MQLDINEIRIGKRLREVNVYDTEYQALLDDMRIHGILQPVVLFKLGNSAPRLSAGLHRLTAMKKLGYTTLTLGKEFVWLDVEGLTPKRAVLKHLFSETSENLRRIQLSPRLRKLFVVEAEKVATKMYLLTKREEQRQRIAAKVVAEKAASAARSAAKRNENSETLDAAREAEYERVLAAKAVERGQKTIVTLVQGVPGTNVTTPREVRDELVKVTGLSRGELVNISSTTRHLYSFITHDELKQHRVCKLIDETPGEYTILESMAVPSAKAFHTGLRDWCDRIRAGKGVEVPSQLREAIKNKNAEAAKLEAQKDEHKAKRTMIDLVAQSYSDLARNIQKMNEHARAVGHESVVKLFKSEQANLEKARQLLSEIKDRTYQRTA